MDVLDGSPRKGRGEEAAQDCATERIERRSQTGKSTSRRVQWTDDEQALFVDHCARHQLEHPEADYLAVLRSGMKEMPEERQRKVIQVHPFEKYRDAIVEKVAELRARHEAPSTPAADTIDSRPERQEFDLPPEFTAETTRDEAAGHSPLSDALARALRDVIADAISQGTQQVEANVAERFQRIEESIERLQHRLDEIAELAEQSRRTEARLNQLLHDLGGLSETPPAEKKKTEQTPGEEKLASLELAQPQAPTTSPESSPPRASSSATTVRHTPEIFQLAEQLRTAIGRREPDFQCNAIIGFKVQESMEAGRTLLSDVATAYLKFFQKHGLEKHFTVKPVEGEREFYLHVQGKNAFGLLSSEAGMHRFETRTRRGSNVTTGAISVTVLAEKNSSEFKLDDNDLKIDRTRASGAGGQHVNTTDSAVRVTHTPSGEMVFIASERSQHANLREAKAILAAKLAAREHEERRDHAHSRKREQVGSRHRAESMRTIDTLRGEVKDSRASKPVLLKQYFKGNFDELIKEVLKTRLAEANGS